MKTFYDIYQGINKKQKGQLYQCNEGFISCWHENDIFIIYYISIIEEKRRCGILTNFLKRLQQQDQSFIIWAVESKEMDQFCKKMCKLDNRFLYKDGNLTWKP